MRKVWINGEIMDEKEAVVSVYDSAMMFGDCAFEMTRSFNKVQYRIEDHILRLFRSAKYLRIPIPYTADELLAACHATQEANTFEPDDEHRLMITVTRGVLPMYSDTGDPGTNIIITDFPLRWTVAGMGRLFDDGIAAVTPSQRALPAHLLDPKVKHRSRIPYLMANIQTSLVHGKNNWAVLLDTDGNIAEGPGWNFFAVFKGTPVSPHLRNILAGVSLATILDIIQASFSHMTEYDVITHAEEAFITATPFCMLPVVSFNGASIGNGKVGPVYTSILKEWSSRVGVDIKKQIQAWDTGKVKGGASAYRFK